ncbi:MAG: TRAP transporter small permease [Desulfuromonadaceae bacterium]|nr:TRAP transporter small permease [Desulfuromonadaceae bacterium]
MKILFKVIGEVINRIEKICLAGSVFALIATIILVNADVFGRQVLDMPIHGSLEIIEDYLMIALVYLSMSYVYTEGGHVRITLFRKFIPGFIKRPLDVALSVVSLLFFILLTVRGCVVTLRAFQFCELSSCVLAYPLAPAYLILALGSALLCIRILQTIIDPSKIKWDEEEHFSEMGGELNDR